MYVGELDGLKVGVVVGTLVGTYDGLDVGEIEGI